MNHCLVDFSRLHRPEQAVALLVAYSIERGDQWSLTGDISPALQHVLKCSRVNWSRIGPNDPLPADARDVTDNIIRITEIERGSARYVYESPHGTIAIAFLSFRYRVLIAGDAYGSFASPRDALAALTRADIGPLDTGAGFTLADCRVPPELHQWKIVRHPERAENSVVSIPPAGGDSVGLARAAREAATQ